MCATNGEVYYFVTDDTAEARQVIKPGVVDYIVHFVSLFNNAEVH